MIKVFTLNKNNKIELTKQELQKLLDEAYWEGWNSVYTSWTYVSPTKWTCDTTVLNSSPPTATITVGDKQNEI